METYVFVKLHTNWLKLKPTVITLLKHDRLGLLPLFKQQFLVFKQHYTYFYILFYLHVLSKNTNNVSRTILPNELAEKEMSCPQYFLNIFTINLK